jgi:signal transduction histidine kinase
MIYSDLFSNHHYHIAFFLVLLTAIVSILIAVRYLFTTRENEVLLREREQSRRHAEQLRMLGTELTNILELDGLLEHIVTLATSELGFDAAMLILVEEYDSPFETSSSFIVRATTKNAGAINNWHIHDPQASAYTVLNGKELHICWADHPTDLPQGIAAWHQKQQVALTYFMPLTFQEKTLGSIGYSSFSANGLPQQMQALAKTYTAQAATIIEHSLLYQTALEQETFAKAMANIAARLNAAFVEPDEVYQLICAEGAYALRADYVLLYGQDGETHLQPLALFVSEEEPLSTIAAWPAITLDAYESEVFTALQPSLLQVNPSATQSPEPVYMASSPGPSLEYPDVFSASTPTRAIVRYPFSSLRQKLLQRFVNTAILAPLASGGRPLGLLVFARSLPGGTRTKKAFTVSNLPQAQDFAEQVAVALMNAQLYQGLQKAHKQLQELDQLKDQFMITASHELRTPLTAVQGYIELMAEYDELLSPEQRKEFMQKARRSCDELVVLLGNVMDASQLDINANAQLARVTPVCVQELINSVIILIEPHLTQEQRKIYLDVPGDLHVLADEGRLRQILVNISNNALKYSPPRTPIAFFAAPFILDNTRYVVISVKDKGKGIARRDQKFLFQRFVRLESDMNSPVRGSGLGLYISRRLIEVMNGKIWIESSGVPGEGSTFSIQLPMIDV